MELKQAVTILKQGLDIATGSGAFKNTQDVAILNVALTRLIDYFNVETEMKGEEPSKEVVTNTKK